MGKLGGKVAIITGATSGIGERIAEMFVAEGARVVAAGRREAEGLALEAKCGPAMSFIRTDVTDETSVKAMVDHAVARFGRLDCLVNNAGSGSPMVSITEVAAEHFSSVFDTNVRAVMFGMKHAAPIMIAQGLGSIITIASAAGLRGGFSGHIYSASKAAVIHLSRNVASEISSRGVRVNTISPGGIVTGIFAKAAGLDGAKADRALRVISIYSPPYSQFDAPGLPTTSPMPRCFSQAMRRRLSPDRTLPSMAVWFHLRSQVGRRRSSSARKSLGASGRRTSHSEVALLGCYPRR